MEWLDSCCLSSLRGIRRPAFIQVRAMGAGGWRREESRISDFNRFSDFGRFGFWMALAAPGGVPEDALHRAVRSGIKITQIGLCGPSVGRNRNPAFIRNPVFLPFTVSRPHAWSLTSLQWQGPARPWLPQKLPPAPGALLRRAGSCHRRQVGKHPSAKTCFPEP